MIGPTKLYENSGNFTMQFVGTSDELDGVPTGVWIPREGDTWYDTTVKTLKYYDGSSWDNPFPASNGIALKAGETVEGVLSWDDDLGTASLGMPGGNVSVQYGEEFVKRVTNGTGSTIADGTPVYISGSQGNNLTIAPADAEFESGIAFRTYAVTTEEILAGQKGYVTKDGVVRDINLSTYAAGVPLYLAVGGGYTIVPPTSPDVTILIGVVEKATADGELDVGIISLPNLSSLSDVLITNLQDGQVLQWNAASSTWKNVTLP